MNLLRAFVFLGVYTVLLAGCTSGGSSATCSLSDPASLADSSWPKFRHDIRNTGHIDGVTLSSTPAIRKTFPSSSGSKFVASPVLGFHDNRIYIGGTNGILYVLDTQTSDPDHPDQLRQLNSTEFTPFTALDAITQAALAATRFSATSEAVFVPSDDGRVQGLDSTGKLQPSFWPFGFGTAVTTAPTINGVDGTLYAGGGSLVHGICPNGIQRFGYSFTGRVRSSVGVGGRGIAYFGADDRLLRAIDPNGTIRWTFALGGTTASATIVEVNDPANPTETDAVYIIDTTGRLYKVDRNGNQQLGVSVPTTVQSASPALSGNRLYVAGDDGSLYAIDKNAASDCDPTGSGCGGWSLHVGGPIHSSPAVATSDDATVIVFGSDDGNLYFVSDDGDSGSIVATVSIGSSIVSSPAIRRNEDGSGTVYVGADDGVLYMIN